MQSELVVDRPLLNLTSLSLTVKMIDVPLEVIDLLLDTVEPGAQPILHSAEIVTEPSVQLHDFITIHSILLKPKARLDARPIAPHIGDLEHLLHQPSLTNLRSASATQHTPRHLFSVSCNPQAGLRHGAAVGSAVAPEDPGVGTDIADEQPEGGAGTCPSWCIIQHDNQDLPDDLMHEGAHREVPTVSLLRHRDQDGTPRRRAAATELSVVRYRYDSDNEEWVYVGDGRSGLDLSPESAQRLARAITALLDAAQAPPNCV